ncbi:hypothetical protein OKW33_006145 [Paraburkholderia atlantica]|uniref:Uncharacterized protein n=1 Tax=Paraburkholderia atlantica TaxID=2654982 RepID=A0A7W8QG49_PARAM|nr:hypothetical protein [Paraburkholderia atlantica]
MPEPAHASGWPASSRPPATCERANVSLPHSPTFFGATPTGFRALFAVFVLMLLALICAGVAVRRAQQANFLRATATTSHDSRREPANVRAVHIRLDACRHLSHVLFGKAGHCAMGASGCACVTGLYARFVLLLCQLILRKLIRRSFAGSLSVVRMSQARKPMRIGVEVRVEQRICNRDYIFSSRLNEVATS